MAGRLPPDLRALAPGPREPRRSRSSRVSPPPPPNRPARWPAEVVSDPRAGSRARRRAPAPPDRTEAGRPGANLRPAGIGWEGVAARKPQVPKPPSLRSQASGPSRKPQVPGSQSQPAMARPFLTNGLSRSYDCGVETSLVEAARAALRADATRPLYARLAEAMAAELERETGRPVPSARALAGELGVNRATLTAAYRELARRGSDHPAAGSPGSRRSRRRRAARAGRRPACREPRPRPLRPRPQPAPGRQGAALARARRGGGRGGRAVRRRPRLPAAP